MVSNILKYEKCSNQPSRNHNIYIMQKLIVIAVMLILTILSGCGYFTGTTVTEEIPDLSKKWDKEMKVELGEGKYVHKVKLRVAGETTGRFLMNKKELGPGKINEVIRNGDYYSTDFPVRYKPVDDTIEGRIKGYVTYYY